MKRLAVKGKPFLVASIWLEGAMAKDKRACFIFASLS